MKRLNIKQKSLAEPTLRVSVIIPSLDGSRHGNVPKLLDDLSRQTVQPLDIHLVKGVTPNGRARNEGVKQASGDFLVFLDDDVRLGHERIIENLIAPLQRDATIGITGASIQIPKDPSWFQRVSAKQTGRNEFPVVSEMVESDMVTTQCCAVSRKVFDEVGRFNEVLLRGVDPEFRHRFRQAGNKIVIVPDSWFYHPMPSTFLQLMKMAFRNGKSSAYGRRVHPELVFETPDKHVGSTVKTHPFWFRALRSGWQFVKALITFQWIAVSTNIAYFIGYAWEFTRHSTVEIES